MLYGHTAHALLPYFVQICEILTFRQTVSLPIIMPQIYKYFCVCNNSCTFFWQNHQHCYPRAKVEVLRKQGVVLFGTYYRKTKRRNGWKNSLVHSYYYKVERFRNCGSPPFLMMATPSETMMDSLLGTITLPLMSIMV